MPSKIRVDVAEYQNYTFSIARDEKRNNWVSWSHGSTTYEFIYDNVGLDEEMDEINFGTNSEVAEVAEFNFHDVKNFDKFKDLFYRFHKDMDIEDICFASGSISMALKSSSKRIDIVK